MPNAPILIAGPTASGKSRAAIHLAAQLGGAIINVDSMQVYDGLRVLTARPSTDEEQAAPHFLYGVIDPGERCSAGRWARLAADVLADVRAQGLRPIFVGGTGLYFRALTEGLSEIPAIPDQVTQKAAARLEAGGIAGLLADVAARDPKTAGRLRPSDGQRIRRAWEVLEATGKGLAAWQAGRKSPVVAGTMHRLVLSPPRDWLYARCESRFDSMINEGALDEVEALLARRLDPSLPAMKALGVRELGGHLRGEMSLEDAKDEAKMLTRRFAKRQMTWMRNQMADWTPLDPSTPDFIHRLSESVGAGGVTLIKGE